MIAQFNELSDTQMETISGGHGCHRHAQHSMNCGGGGIMGELRGLLASLGKISNSNISIVIVENATINAPLTISVTQGVA
jgi:bacteriocin-like protein